MIDREHALPVSRQAELLELSRSAVYYQPVPVSDADLALMRRIDELHLDYPFAGSRMLKRLLQDEGFEVGRTHVRTLMRRMGIEAIYRRPRTSRPHPGHRACSVTGAVCTISCPRGYMYCRRKGARRILVAARSIKSLVNQCKRFRGGSS